MSGKSARRRPLGSLAITTSRMAITRLTVRCSGVRITAMSLLEAAMPFIPSVLTVWHGFAVTTSPEAAIGHPECTLSDNCTIK